MTILFLALWLQMSAPPQIGSTSNTITCYTRYSGLCQGSPLTADEKAADEVEKQIDVLLNDLGNRRDMSAADVLYIGETARKRMFNGGEQLLKNLQEIEERAVAADETDGKPPDNSKKPKICEVRQVYKEGDIEDVTLSCIPDLKAEPVDVPAVREHDQISQPVDISDEKPFAEGCHAAGFHYNWSLHGCMHPRYTCKDKSRILERDENSPPKYWCRKVQP